MISFEYLKELQLNPYEVLEVSNSASKDEIKKAYRKLALRYHPDKVANNREDEDINNKFLLVSDVYKFLTDEETAGEKARYDMYIQREKRLDDEQDVVMQDVNEKKEKLRSLEKRYRELVEKEKQRKMYREYEARMEKQKLDIARERHAERKKNMIDRKMRQVLVSTIHQITGNEDLLRRIFEDFGRLEDFTVTDNKMCIEYESVFLIAKLENSIAQSWNFYKNDAISLHYSKLLKKLVKDVKWNGIVLQAGNNGVVYRRLTEMYPNSGKLSIEDYKEMTLLRYVTVVENKGTGL